VASCYRLGQQDTHTSEIRIKTIKEGRGDTKPKIKAKKRHRKRPKRNGEKEIRKSKTEKTPLCWNT